MEEWCKERGIPSRDTTEEHLGQSSVIFSPTPTQEKVFDPDREFTPEEEAEMFEQQRKFNQSPEAKAMTQEFIENLKRANEEEDANLKKLGLR